MTRPDKKSQKTSKKVFYYSPFLKFNQEGDREMEIQKFLFTLLVILLCLPIVALAAPDVSIDTVAEKEVVETVDGKPVKKRVTATNADPGQNLIFTLSYKNRGNEKALNVKIDNPIPANTTYVVGSGIGKNSNMMFSIDGGKTYKAPSLLKYTVTLNDGKKVEKQASPDQYTNVRWVINEIPPGESGKVGFQVKVK